MKTFFYRKDFPSLFLLVSYLVYIIINKNASISDGIVVFALSSIYSYHQYLIQQEIPNYDKKIEEVRLEANKEISKLRDEMAKFQMSGAKPVLASRKISF